MDDSHPLREKLDPLCMEMLVAVDQHDGVASTREIRDFIGVDNTTRTNYRIREYLEPMGLVRVMEPEFDELPVPPNELHLTDDGKEFLESVDESEQEIHRDIGERLGMVEEQLDGLQEQIMQVQESGVSQDSDTEKSGVDSGELEDLQKQISKIAAEVRDIKQSPLFDETIQEQLDVGLLASAVAKEILIDEFGEDRYREIWGQKKAELDFVQLDQED